MSKIDAMEIWNKISGSERFVAIQKFYQKNGKSKDDVLKQGAADFDEMVGVPD
ncbi:MAG: hypothetical protein HAW65_06820 [Alphaproteobacteria bacterium]|nr:hypothetical protein [Alphaproteobacteria bacterium]